MGQYLTCDVTKIDHFKLHPSFSMFDKRLNLLGFLKIWFQEHSILRLLMMTWGMLNLQIHRVRAVSHWLLESNAFVFIASKIPPRFKPTHLEAPICHSSEFATDPKLLSSSEQTTTGTDAKENTVNDFLRNPTIQWNELLLKQKHILPNQCCWNINECLDFLPLAAL